MITEGLVKVGLAAALVVALVFGVNWYNGRQQGIGYDRAVAEFREKENADLKAALLETERLKGVIKEANDAAKIRETEIRRLSGVLAGLNGRLRDTDARINAIVSSATADALAQATRAYAGLFAECRAEYVAVGQAAAGHRSDVKTLTQAWPQK